MKPVIAFCFACFGISTTMFSQNVGINTTNPDRPLTIRAASGNNELISLRDTVNTPLWHVNMLNNGLNFVRTGVANGRLFLSNDGYAGIGTTSPTYPLQVHNAILSSIALFSSASQVAQIHVSNGNTIAQVGTDSDGMYVGTEIYPSGNKDLRFRTNTNDRIIIKDATGNVGIGTNTPAAKLDVRDTSANSNVANFSSAGITGELRVSNNLATTLLGVDNDGAYVGAANDNSFRITSGGLSRIFVEATSGNVGIGTIDPGTPLHVHTTGATIAHFSSSAAITEMNISNSSNTAQIGMDGVGMFAGPTGNKDFRIKTNGTERMIVKDGSGNIGINIFSPTAKLHVNGNAIIEDKLVINDTAVASSLRVTGAIASTSASININSGPQTINPGNKSYLFINNTGVAAATITLGDGVADGQVLYILAGSTLGGGVQFVDNILNNTQLSSGYLMTLDDTLMLIWNKAQGLWFEIHRSVN